MWPGEPPTLPQHPRLVRVSLCQEGPASEAGKAQATRHHVLGPHVHCAPRSSQHRLPVSTPVLLCGWRGGLRLSWCMCPGQCRAACLLGQGEVARGATCMT